MSVFLCLASKRILYFIVNNEVTLVKNKNMRQELIKIILSVKSNTMFHVEYQGKTS